MRRYAMLGLSFALGLALGMLFMALLRGGGDTLPIAPPVDGERIHVNAIAEYHRPVTDVAHWYGRALAVTPAVDYPRFAVSSVVGGMEIQVLGMYTGGKTLVHISAGR